MGAVEKNVHGGDRRNMLHVIVRRKREERSGARGVFGR